MLRGSREKRKASIYWNYYNEVNQKSGGNPISKISAHHRSATVATFRSWRGLQSTIAKPPIGLPLQEQSIEIFSVDASLNCHFKQAIHSFDYLTINLTFYRSNSAQSSPKKHPIQIKPTALLDADSKKLLEVCNFILQINF